MPRVLAVDAGRPDPGAIAQAVAALRRGDLVVVPTETVYGVAADPRVPGALAKLRGAKGRPADKPIARLVPDLASARAEGAALGVAAERLARRFWPGPLTLVARSPGGAVGYRVPDHAVTLLVLRAAGAALAVTSANLSGEAPAVTASQAVASLGEHVALVLDAGPSPGGVPSTVVRADGERVEILREGAIGRERILAVAGGRGEGNGGGP